MKRIHKKTDKTVDSVFVELGTNGKKRYCIITISGSRVFNSRVEGDTYMECGFLAQRQIFEVFPQVKHAVDAAFQTVAETAVLNAQIHARRQRNRVQHAKKNTATAVAREHLLDLDAEYQAKARQFRTGKLK